jgi:hypothetical protein
MTPKSLRRLFPIIPLVVVVIGVELAAYVYRAVRCPGAPPSFAIPNAEYGWMHPPGVEVQAFACAGTSYEWKNTVEFNSRGLNDEEHGYTRKPGIPRVLVLGDSVAEALQVERSENFSERLEKMFAANGRQVEVINTGHAGFGTDNEVLFYETEGHRYDPDVVVLELNLQNDIAENSPTTVRRMYAGGPVHPKAGVKLRADGGVDLDTTEFSRAADLWASDPWRSWEPLVWLRRHSFFFRRISDVVRGSQKPVSAAPPANYPAELDVYAVPVTADWLEARKMTEALLRRLRRVVEKDGARLVVVVVPSRETVAPAQWESLVAWFPKLANGKWDLEMPRRWALDYLTAEAFTVVDTTEALRRGQAETQSSGYFAFDPHPNARGHAWIAESLYRAFDGSDERSPHTWLEPLIP